MANTVSTKSGRSKQAHARKREIQQGAVETTASDISEWFWRIGVLAILVIAAVLRLYDLELVPLHHDEGVNGNFLVRLARDGSYQYDPENYHGPTLYYFAALIPWLARLLFGVAARDTYGLTTFSIRLVPAVFGLATIGLVFLLRRRLGTVATLTAGLLLALSPGAVYLSRYFIHETQFVFFTLAIVVAAVYFYDQRNAFYLIPAAASAALLFATKETAMISAGVLIIAFGVTHLYKRIYLALFGPIKTKGKTQSQRWTYHRFVEEFGGPIVVIVCFWLAVLAFVSLYAAFYSSFFTNEKGIYDSFRTFAVWRRTGTLAHVHPWLTYFKWLIRQESPLLLLGAIGAAFVVLKPRNSLALFIALWSFGLIAAYSLIPYKTPWLVLNFVVPLALIAGHAVQTIYEWDRRQLRLTVAFVAIAACVASYQTIDLNFINYDNDNQKYVYVYAHTKREMLALVEEIEKIAGREQGALTGITIVSPDYWPLPWYLRNYSRVGYYGRMATSSEPIIIANANQKEELEARLGQSYQQVPSSSPGGGFELRPGVSLLIYERRGG